MFWILRRTGAVNFFNSINSNYSAKGNNVNNVYNDQGELFRRGTRDRFLKKLIKFYKKNL